MRPFQLPHQLRHHLRTVFSAGLLFLVPLAITLWVLYTVFNLLDSLLGRWLVPLIGFRVPGLGLLATLLLVYLVGLIASDVAGRQLIGLWDSFASRLPLVRSVYKVAKEVSHAFGRRDRRPFRQVVSVEFPRKGLWTLGFLTAEVTAGGPFPEGFVYVFIPTTPNPTSGWLILAPREEVRPMPYSVDEGMRIIISAGIVGPGQVPSVSPAPGQEEDRGG
jgi:uncharacterized membrane protein